MNILDNDCKTHYIYLLQIREHRRLKEPIYKLGKTTQETVSRFKQYPKGSVLIYQSICVDCSTAERELLNLFRIKYIPETNVDTESFRGCYRSMRKDIDAVINKQLDILEPTLSQVINPELNYKPPIAIQPAPPIAIQPTPPIAIQSAPPIVIRSAPPIAIQSASLPLWMKAKQQVINDALEYNQYYMILNSKSVIAYIRGSNIIAIREIQPIDYGTTLPLVICREDIPLFVSNIISMYIDTDTAKIFKQLCKYVLVAPSPVKYVYYEKTSEDVYNLSQWLIDILSCLCKKKIYVTDDNIVDRQNLPRIAIIDDRNCSNIGQKIAYFHYLGVQHVIVRQYGNVADYYTDQLVDYLNNSKDLVKIYLPKLYKRLCYIRDGWRRKEDTLVNADSLYDIFHERRELSEYFLKWCLT